MTIYFQDVNRPEPQVKIMTPLGDERYRYGNILPQDKSQVYTYSFYTPYLGEHISILKEIEYPKKSQCEISLDQQRFRLDTYDFNTSVTHCYLSQQSRIIGYLHTDYFSLTYHQDQDFVQAIRRMDRNHTRYFVTPPSFTQGVFNFYVSEHDGYVEEYVFLDLDSPELLGKINYLVMETFYPKILEAKMRPIFLEQLQQVTPKA